MSGLARIVRLGDAIMEHFFCNEKVAKSIAVPSTIRQGRDHG